MVRRAHCYADGGKIVKDHTATDYRYPAPTYGEAVKDRVKSMFSSGAAAKAGKQVSGRQRQIDKAVDDAS